MKRYHITLGARTTVGGTVISASSRGSINDKAIAVEGDSVFCSCCGSRGYIICTGPRHPETWDNKQVALENDFCACKCSPTPRLIAIQSLRYQEVAAEPPYQKSSKAQAASKKPNTNKPYDERVRVKSTDGKPMSNVPYHITDESGNVYKGVTDENGCCDRIYTDSEEKLTILTCVHALEKW